MRIVSVQKPGRCLLLVILSVAISLAACRKEKDISRGDETPVGEPDSLRNGFYLLNEGNTGMNLATLDYYNSSTGIYKSNIYSEVNPGATKELGDVGNDLKVYGSKLYAVINMSDKVEVMDVHSAKRKGQINVRNCRYITFYNGKAYVSSYATAPGDPGAGAGFIAEVDTATLQVLRTVTVGRQPEEMAIIGDKLYVANSGGYSAPNYERIVSVVDMKSFSEMKRINVALNPHRLRADKYGDVYITSRGNYYETPSKLYVIDSRQDIVKDSFDLAASNVCISGDSAYVYSVEWSYVTNSNTVSYAIIDIKDERKLADNFITDGTDKQIKTPYGMAIDPQNGDIYVTDAKDYLLPGTLYCFSKAGKKKWSVTTGDIPAHFAFVPK
jgi:DNA-binding beta-propeller fold protein YncE